MMGSAQLDFVPEEETVSAADVPQPSALRRQAAERLAAHRQRRERQDHAAASEAQNARPAAPRHRAAAAVAERYAHTPSYRAILAEQARRAIKEAAAAAEIAQRNAEAVAAAQHELLGELELWNAPQEFSPATAQLAAPIATQSDKVSTPSHTPWRSRATDRPTGLTVRLYEDLRQALPAAPPAAHTPATRPRHTQPDAAETLALDAEIAFRQAPVFDEFWTDAEPAVPLPANLLEFPRQLIAARRARPRLAEGPLREEITPRTAQLRIFEVEPDQISTAPDPVPAAPEWTSIRLDAHTVTPPEANPDAPPMPILPSLLPPQAAPLALRTMATLVDATLVGAAALAAVAVYARLAGEITLGLPFAGGIVVLLAGLHLVYQLLFFTLSDQTPGMRYARIGLCTFTDENPSRSALRRRILAQCVALVPAGMGLLWIVLDEDRLGWHDRLSRMYQRAY